MQKSARIWLIMLVVVALIVTAVALQVRQASRIGDHDPGYRWIPRPMNMTAAEVHEKYGPILVALAGQIPNDEIVAGPTFKFSDDAIFCTVKVEVQMKNWGGVDAVYRERIFDDVLVANGFEKARSATESSGRGFTIARQQRGGSAIFQNYWQTGNEMLILVPITKRACQS